MNFKEKSQAPGLFTLLPLSIKALWLGGRDHATHHSEHLSPAAAALVRLVLPEPVCQKRDVWLLRFSLSIPCPHSTDWAALAFADVAQHSD